MWRYGKKRWCCYFFPLEIGGFNILLFTASWTSRSAKRLANLDLFMLTYLFMPNTSPNSLQKEETG